jgi:hypothetical protein
MLAIVSIREGAWSPSARSMPTVDFGGGCIVLPRLAGLGVTSKVAIGPFDAEGARSALFSADTQC